MPRCVVKVETAIFLQFGKIDMVGGGGGGGGKYDKIHERIKNCMKKIYSERVAQKTFLHWPSKRFHKKLCKRFRRKKNHAWKI